MNDWAITWKMEFNIGKCKIMHVGRKNKKYDYEMNGEKLSITDKEKDLGVLMESNLKPNSQCTAAATKANQILGQISRAFHYRHKEVFVKLFKTFVRPHLEYCSSVWSPWTEKDCEILEKVQKRAVRMVSNLEGGTYEEKLECAGLMKLKDRRKRGDLIETCKIMKGFVKTDKSKLFDIHQEEEYEVRRTRMNMLINEEGESERRENVIRGVKSKTDLRKNFFSQRVCNEWNSLPEKVKEAPNVNCFKNRYDQYMKPKKHESRTAEDGDG